MAKKIFTLPWTMQEVKTFTDGIVSAFSGGFLAWLNRTREKPFALVYDEKDKNKKFFHTEEEAKAYFEARDNDELTPEIEAYRFIKETVPGEEQYKLSFNVLNIDDSATYGQRAVLRFSFATADTLNGNRPTEESIEIYFTFTSDAGTKTETKRFAYSEGVTEFDITQYIEPDANEISMMVKGLSSGLTLTARATWTAVHLPFDSTFDIAEDRKQGVNFGIPYSVSGIGAKEVEFVIDSGTPFNDTVYEGTANKTYNLKNTLAPGVHTLQMKAFTTVNNKRFESDMLYFEFVVNGEGLDLTTTVVKARFASGTPYFMERKPGLVGEQYVDYLLQWAYFSTSKPNAIVMWKTKLNGVETVVGSREVDEMEGNVGVMPDPVKFQPDVVGTYDLYAYIKGDEEHHIGEYTINVSENSAGLRKADNPTFEVNAKGRSNSEPSDTISDWSSNGYKAIFNDKMTFDGMAGWTGDAMRFDNGAQAVINCKPFAVENAVIANGATVLINFRTFNVEEEDALLMQIGDPDAPATAFIGLYGKRIVVRPSTGAEMTYPFASEEDTHIAVVIQPKTGVTDKQMMFLIINGIEAPGRQYEDTAVFNIGSYSKQDGNGMIVLGNADNKAAIEVRNIAVYPYALSMWQGMNNFMIDKGGDVGAMMKKNDLFANQDFNRPVINKIKEQFRVLEIIGDLGKLEASSKKENFYGSCIYTDPFNPKFNFYRTDGGAYIETAGQSRLEDLMAKSFHLDLNENDTVATYQDGKLTHKNRFVFADGNIAENGVRIDVCGADSSMVRNAVHMKLVNKYCPLVLVDGEYVLRTPPQQYALGGKWGQDMKAAFGGNIEDYIWQWNINHAPDSVPIVVVWHEREDDPIQVYGLAQMTEEKKASYANGNHSIYIKQKLADGTFDPFDRLPGVKGNRGWDNAGIEEVEYVNPSDLTNNVSLSGFEDEITRNYSFELCFPKKKDLLDGGLEVWGIFKNEYLKPITETYGNQEAFDAIVENVFYLPSFAFYYNKVLDRKMNDSLCRNMHCIRYNMGTAQNPKWRWWLKFWDADVSLGLFQSNVMGVDPETDRQTLGPNGRYVMEGHDMWIWNALERNAKFKEWCKKMAIGTYDAGWSAQTEKQEVDKIVSGYSEALYNLDGLLKFLNAFRKGNDYLLRMQGSSVAYIHGFIEASYAVREAQEAIGAYASRSASITATGATHPCEVRMSASSKWRFGLGTTTTNIVTGIEKRPEDGEFAIAIPVGMSLARDFLSVYGADHLRMLDFSDFTQYMSRAINLGHLRDCQQLFIGYKPDHLGTINNDKSVSFTGIENMTRLTHISLRGLRGLGIENSFDISSLIHLTHYYAGYTSLKNFKPADGTKFVEVELPDTTQTIECRNVQLGTLTFQGGACPVSLLLLSLVGMGNDEGAHALVHQWLEMLRANEYLIQTAKITFRAINWQGIDKQDLLTLARIPKAQRNLTGYVFCDTIYTDTERQLLTDAFGKNVFDPDAKSVTLVCDANGKGISITGTGETAQMSEDGVTIEQGNTLMLTGAGFPISGSSAKNYRWGAWINNENTILNGSDDYPDVMLDENTTINRLTGVLTTTEGTQPAKTYDIRCLDIVSGAAGKIDLTVKPRSYPSEVHIEFKGGTASTSVVAGELQITSVGKYYFSAKHLPEEFSGTMALTDGGKWTLVGDYDNIVEGSDNRSNPTVDFCLSVLRLQGEQSVRLCYESNWRNGLHLEAQDVLIAVIALIEQALGSAEGVGNPALFNKIRSMGIEPSSPTYYSSGDLKLVEGTIDLTDSDIQDFRSRSLSPTATYVVTRFLKNVIGLNLANCTRLTQQGLDEALEQMPWVKTINVEGTSLGMNVVPSSLQKQTLGLPTIINTGVAEQFSSANVTLQGSENVEKVISLGLSGNDTYKWLQNALFRTDTDTLQRSNNSVLFDILEKAGVRHAVADAMTMQEIFDAHISTFDIPSLLNQTGHSIDELTSINGCQNALVTCYLLNANGCTGMETLDVRGMKHLAWIETTGTDTSIVADASNNELRDFTLGMPRSISVRGVPIQNIVVEDNNNLDNVVIISVGNKGKVFNALTKIFYNVLYPNQ